MTCLKIRFPIAALVMALLVSCNSNPSEDGGKYILQICTGGWNNCNYSAEEIIKRLDKVTAEIPVEKVIIGWNLEAEQYRKIGSYLHPKGISMDLWLPVFSEIGNIADAERSVDLWGQETGSYALQEGEDFTFYCPSSTVNINAVKSIYGQYFSECGFDGVFLDKIRTASYVAGQNGVLSCGCDRCMSIYAEHNVDIESLKAKAQKGIVIDDATMADFLKAKAEIISCSVGELEDWFHSKGLEVGLDLFAPELTAIVGQDIAALSQKADYVKPMMYRKTDAPAGIGFEKRAIDPGFSDADLSDDYLYRELVKAVDLSGCMVCPGIEVNYREDIARTSPEYIKESIRAIHRAGIKHIVLAWDVMLAPDSHIEAVASME